MLWDVFGAYVVGYVRGTCCGTCIFHVITSYYDWGRTSVEFPNHVKNLIFFMWLRHIMIGAALRWSFPITWKIPDFSCDWNILWLGPHFGGVSHSHEKSHIFHVIRSYYDWGRTSVEFPNHMKNLRFFMWLGHIMIGAALRWSFPFTWRISYVSCENIHWSASQEFAQLVIQFTKVPTVIQYELPFNQSVRQKTMQATIKGCATTCLLNLRQHPRLRDVEQKVLPRCSVFSSIGHARDWINKIDDWIHPTLSWTYHCLVNPARQAVGRPWRSWLCGHRPWV